MNENQQNIQIGDLSNKKATTRILTTSIWVDKQIALNEHKTGGLVHFS